MKCSGSKIFLQPLLGCSKNEKWTEERQGLKFFGTPAAAVDVVTVGVVVVVLAGDAVVSFGHF